MAMAPITHGVAIQLVMGGSVIAARTYMVRTRCCRSTDSDDVGGGRMIPIHVGRPVRGNAGEMVRHPRR